MGEDVLVVACPLDRWALGSSSDAQVDAGLGSAIERTATVAPTVELRNADGSTAGSLGHVYDLSASLLPQTGHSASASTRLMT